MGSSPPLSPMALLQLAVRENGVRVCSFWGVSDKVREWVVKEFRLLADPDVLTTEQRVQPARKAKLMCIPIVDSDIEHQLVAYGSSSSSSSSSSNSSDSSSEGPSGADSDNGGQDVSGGSTASATDSHSSSSSGSNLETPSRSKKYRRVAVHIGRDVDAMSSDACPVRMLNEGEYSVHTSS